MAHRGIHRLTAKQVEKQRTPGRYADGGGLYLQVQPAAAGGFTQSWLFRFKFAGRAREMGLGPVHTIGLAEAREKAKECRKQLLDGVDPIDARDEAAARKAAEVANFQTMKQCAEAYMRSHRSKWTNAKHAAQWANTFETYVYPKIGTVPINQVDTTHVLRVLEQPVNVGSEKHPQMDPLWTARAETASRLRGRLEKVLGWAKSRKLRDGDNPAAWKDHLEHALLNVPRTSRIEHHPAMPYDGVPQFVAELREQQDIAPRALEFAILCWSRTGEVVGAMRSEVDLELGIWTIPGERMKNGGEHRVPLVARAIEILREMEERQHGDFVFPGRQPGTGLSNMALLAVLRRMKRGDYTTHGFRSSARTWAEECTQFPREICEKALAHTVGDETERAYNRGDAFEKRRKLHEAWARYLEKPPANVHVLEPKDRAAGVPEAFKNWPTKMVSKALQDRVNAEAEFGDPEILAKYLREHDGMTPLQVALSHFPEAAAAVEKVWPHLAPPKKRSK